MSAAASAELRSEHPIARAVVAYAREHGAQPEEPGRFEALPGRGVRAIVSGKRILILAVRREGRSVIVDLFNTSARRRTVTLTSRLASRRRITLTDMLTRPISSCPRGRITIAAKAFARVVIA